MKSPYLLTLVLLSNGIFAVPLIQEQPHMVHLVARNPVIGQKGLEDTPASKSASKGSRAFLGSRLSKMVKSFKSNFTPKSTPNPTPKKNLDAMYNPSTGQITGPDAEMAQRKAEERFANGKSPSHLPGEKTVLANHMPWVINHINQLPDKVSGRTKEEKEWAKTSQKLNDDKIKWSQQVAEKRKQEQLSKTSG